MTAELQHFYDYLGEARPRKLTAKEQYRVHRTLALVPAGVDRVLDVASGDGRLARHLVDAGLTVQCDISLASLAVAAGNRVQADVAGLPFGDRVADLVLCCEGLEHFPEEIFQRAREEIARVSARHILISVPFREDTLANTTRCGNCNYVFHKWGHVRRFTLPKLRTLFPGFSMARYECFGKSQPFKLGIAQKINQRWAGRYAEPAIVTVCPKCGEQSYRLPPRNAVSVTMGIINRMTSRIVPTGNHHWIAAVYDRS